MAERIEELNPQAKRAIELASLEAHRFNHNYMGTEHLLLGLVRADETLAAKVLRSLGVELNKVRSAVEFIIGRGNRTVVGELGLTPGGKRVVEAAFAEADRLNHDYVGTEHLLLGLVRVGEGIAAGALESLGVSLDKLRSVTLEMLAEEQTQTATLKCLRYFHSIWNGILGEENLGSMSIILHDVWSAGGRYVRPGEVYQNRPELLEFIRRLKRSVQISRLEILGPVLSHHQYATYQWQLLERDGRVYARGTHHVELNDNGQISLIVEYLSSENTGN